MKVKDLLLLKAASILRQIMALGVTIIVQAMSCGEVMEHRRAPISLRIFGQGILEVFKDIFTF